MTERLSDRLIDVRRTLDRSFHKYRLYITSPSHQPLNLVLDQGLEDLDLRALARRYNPKMRYAVEGKAQQRKRQGETKSQIPEQVNSGQREEKRSASTRY
ncbi:hypothetical protein Q3G72_024592 [Acer saccharum]|nr:hypothetical protein Q3G72_024592 [Acer saccharum]